MTLSVTRSTTLTIKFQDGACFVSKNIVLTTFRHAQVGMYIFTGVRLIMGRVNANCVEPN